MGRIPWQLRFALLALLWGSSFLWIKLALRGFAPLQVAAGRLALGAVVLLAIVLATRQALPRSPRLWLHLAVAGLFLNALPFSLFAWAETEVSSLFAGIVNAAAPLVTVAAASAMLPEERPDRRRLAGLAIGLVGVVVVFGAWRGVGEVPLAGQLAALGATVSYGVAYPYVRRFLSGSGVPLIVLAACQLAAATAMLAPFVPLGVDAVPAEALLAVAVLGLAGTALAYVVSYSLLRDRGATTTALVNYPIPLVAVALGIAVLGEPLQWNQPVGGAIVLAGVALCEGRLGSRRRAPA